MVSPITRLLYAVQEGVCAGCGRKMNPLKRIPVGDHTANATRDHVTPRALGGSEDISNQVLLCLRCNGRKGDRPPTGCEIICLYIVNARLVRFYPYSLEKVTLAHMRHVSRFRYQRSSASP